jgi:hypothetical protein
MCGFLARMSNVTNLRLEGFTTTVRILWPVSRVFCNNISNYQQLSNPNLCSITVFFFFLSYVGVFQALLDQKSQEFPVFRNLNILCLVRCDVGAINSQVLLRILEGTPNLENIAMLLCKVVYLNCIVT